MNKTTIVSIALLMLACSSALAVDLVGIKTGTGMLLLNQDPENYFSIEIQASKMPSLGNFLVGKNQLQITSTLVSDFIDDPSAVNDARTVLEKHSEYEKSYIEENVVHAPLKLKSHYENGSLYWTATGSKYQFRVFTTVHNHILTMLSAVILDPASSEEVLLLQKNAWATLKFRDAPWSISEIEAFSNRYRSNH
jgi:hypothetical protein